MQHTYCVSSCFYSHYMCLVHHRSFSSFPSTSVHGLRLLPSCFPSAVVCEFLIIKNKLHIGLNTHSMSFKEVVKITVHNINPYTWYWMIKDTSENVISSDYQGIIWQTFMECDELLVQKWKDQQHFFELTFLQHMEFVKCLFGDSVGLGVRKFVSCSLRNTTASTIEKIPMN